MYKGTQIQGSSARTAHHLGFPRPDMKMRSGPNHLTKILVELVFKRVVNAEGEIHRFFSDGGTLEAGSAEMVEEDCLRLRVTLHELAHFESADSFAELS